MKYVNKYRDAELVHGVIKEIRRTVTRPWVLMEICGGQTHAIVRHGIDQLLPPEIELVHGPGRPVCETPLELIDKALTIASQPDVWALTGKYAGDVADVHAPGGLRHYEIVDVHYL